MNRTTDPNIIEHRLLELAYTTDAKITAPVLAYYAPCSIEDAERVLESLAARDRITMEIDDEGQIVYEVPDRQKLKARREEPQPPTHVQGALARIDYHTPLALRGGRQASPGLAAVLSLALPGAGQVYAGHILGGLMWFLLVSAGYALLLPGLFLHLLCIANAASSAHKLNAGVQRLHLQSG